MKRKLVAFALLLSAFGAASAADNPELLKLYDLDQSARRTQNIDWKKQTQIDKAHQVRALEMLRNGEVRTARDHLHAAMIFQHGQALEDHQLAFALAVVASKLDPALMQAKWLSAAAWDRAHMGKQVPQWYGTQYQSPDGGPMVLYRIDESLITDEERKALGVPPLQEAKALAKQLNGGR